MKTDSINFFASRDKALYCLLWRNMRKCTMRNVGHVIQGAMTRNFGNNSIKAKYIWEFSALLEEIYRTHGSLPLSTFQRVALLLNLPVK